LRNEPPRELHPRFPQPPSFDSANGPGPFCSDPVQSVYCINRGEIFNPAATAQAPRRTIGSAAQPILRDVAGLP